MAAFDRVLSGIPEMDKHFDNIRLGDNVVWRVDNLEQFKLFMKPYVKQAIFENEKTIVFNPDILKEYENILCDFDPALSELSDIVHVADVSKIDFRLCNDMKKEKILCFYAK